VDETERLVVDVVRDVLGVDDVSLDANFFELGGDSLTAIEVATRVEEASGRPVTVDAVYDAESLAAFATTLRSLAAAET
jgi:acyl carrier protein